MNTKFYLCPTCGNLICMVEDSGVVPHCCGGQMELLKPRTVEVGSEKHLPDFVWETDGRTLRVKISTVEHPMMTDHYIKMICLETQKGIQIQRLDGERKAEAEFCCCNDEPVALYAYCNVHGLWKIPCNNGKLHCKR